MPYSGVLAFFIRSFNIRNRARVGGEIATAGTETPNSPLTILRPFSKNSIVNQTKSLIIKVTDNVRKHYI